MPDLVDDGSAPGDQPIPNTMDRLQVQLVFGLDRDKPHVLTFDDFSDSLGINEVCMLTVNVSSCFCVNFFRTRILPPAPSATK